MYLIKQITSDPKQKQTLVLFNGENLELTIEYKPQQLGWFITELIYGDFTLKGFRICTLPNILHQFKNQLPFGIACFTQENQEPTQLESFSSGQSVLYIMDEDELEELQEILANG